MQGPGELPPEEKLAGIAPATRGRKIFAMSELWGAIGTAR